MIRTEIDSMPTELDVIQRKIIQHEIEEAALKKEKDAISQAHLQEIQKELAEMREQFGAMKAKWDNEKEMCIRDSVPAVGGVVAHDEIPHIHEILPASFFELAHFPLQS